MDGYVYDLKEICAKHLIVEAVIRKEFAKKNRLKNYKKSESKYEHTSYYGLMDQLGKDQPGLIADAENLKNIDVTRRRESHIRRRHEMKLNGKEDFLMQ